MTTPTMKWTTLQRSKATVSGTYVRCVAHMCLCRWGDTEECNIIQWSPTLTYSLARTDNSQWSDMNDNYVHRDECEHTKQQQTEKDGIQNTTHRRSRCKQKSGEQIITHRPNVSSRQTPTEWLYGRESGNITHEYQTHVLLRRQRHKNNKTMNEKKNEKNIILERQRPKGGQKPAECFYETSNEKPDWNKLTHYNIHSVCNTILVGVGCVFHQQPYWTTSNVSFFILWFFFGKVHNGQVTCNAKWIMAENENK